MIIAYTRTYSNKQQSDNQKNAIEQFAANNNMTIDKWHKDTRKTSSRHKNRLEDIIKNMEAGDTLIVADVTRLSRRLMEIMHLILLCIEKKITLYCLKEGYTFENNVDSKTLAFTFGLVSEIESKLISTRTKESLEITRSRGTTLGRPKGTPKMDHLLAQKEQIEKDEQTVLEYLRTEKKLVEPEILLEKIKTDTLFKVDGFKMWLSGRTNERLIFRGANQLLLSNDKAETLKKISKYVQRRKENKSILLNDRDGVGEEALEKLYGAFLEKLKGTIYGVRLSAQAETLVNKKEQFMKLTKEEKCMILYEILHIFQCQSGSANLKAIGGPGKAGILVMNNNITNCKQISIINQSPTGIYEEEIDLLKL